MLLVIDISDLNLEISEADIKINSNADFNVQTLLDKICDGIEEIGNSKLQERKNLYLVNTINQKLDMDKKITDLTLNEWDTLYIVRSR
jgi:hypothetical protein